MTDRPASVFHPNPNNHWSTANAFFLTVNIGLVQ
nr:MAG TPA: hypothetical protein [Caudoviricetes sp.]